MEKQQDEFLPKILNSLKVTFPNTALQFLLGHPFDLLKTQKQANQSHPSAFSQCLRIYQQRGWKGFYAGGIPSASRLFFKQAYRHPLRGFIYFELQKQVPQWSISTKATIVSLCMASVDTMISLPLDRIKVAIMTSSQSIGVREFLQQQHSFQNLFKGATISLLRSAVSWVSFLVPEANMRSTIYKLNPQLDIHQQLPFLWKILIGISGGIINGIVTHPLDTIKTNVQKQSFTDKASVKNMYQVGKNLVQQHGFYKGLYPGFVVRLVHYSVIGVVSADLIQKIDHIWQSHRDEN